MIWLLSSFLTASLLTSAEYALIVLTCSPFWLGLDIFFVTLIIYWSLIYIGSLFLSALLSVIPPLRRFFYNNIRRFLLVFLPSWIIGSMLMFLLLKRDLESGSAPWILSAISFSIGVIVVLLLVKICKKRKSLLLSIFLISISIIFLANCASTISMWHFTSPIRERSAHYEGSISNLCLLVLDTTRGDHFSCYGYLFRTTPNMDLIAKEGLLCKNSFSASNWTPPGHISIFTGKYPSQHGNGGQPYMPDELISLTEILREQGYYCVALYNNKIAGNSANITQGFDLDIGVFTHSWVYPTWKRLRDKFVYNDHGAKATFSMAFDTFEKVSKIGGHLFLYINIFEPHMEYVIHEPFFSEFTGSLHIDEIPNLKEIQSLCSHRNKVVYDSSYFSEYKDVSYRYLRAVYDSELAYVDQQFGYFTENLRKSGLLSEMLLVITGDHGEFLGEHYTCGHPPILYNPVLSIPMIMYYPKLIQASVIEEYVSNTDVLPTVLNLMGYSELIPNDVQGIDIFNDTRRSNRMILSENLQPVKESMEYPGYCASLFDGSFKLMLNRDPALLDDFPLDTLLLNMMEDPGELEDMHLSKTDLTAEMLECLREWVSTIQVVPTKEVELSAETIANLRALGYIQ